MLEKLDLTYFDSTRPRRSPSPRGLNCIRAPTRGVRPPVGGLGYALFGTLPCATSSRMW